MVLESNFEYSRSRASLVFGCTGVTFLMVMDCDYLTKWKIINQKLLCWLRCYLAMKECME